MEASELDQYSLSYKFWQPLLLLNKTKHKKVSSDPTIGALDIQPLRSISAEAQLPVDIFVSPIEATLAELQDRKVSHILVIVELN